ncbi:hypothetical protein Ahy_A04g018287 [Arachis hypogaea]|uniref:Uncharacterized protein n=1 Tax=Arachis hypogaea TaxID=3818 RepID=A0A445DDC0_ARAHY|nr:hypothetical protein Ahy_A04g018287 [Arachis hypogaea]
MTGIGRALLITFYRGVKAKMSRAYPYPYSGTTLMYVMAALLSVTFSFCVEKDLSQQKLGYSDFGSDGGCNIVVPTHERISTILDEKIYLKSIIGSLLIV